MPVALLLIGAGVFVTGISALAMHNSVSKSNSKATSSSNILSEIEETKKSFDEEIKKKLLQGTVTIVVYIQYRQQIKKQQHEEMIRSIGGGVTAAASALATAVVINNVQDAIADSQKEQGQQIGSTTSETTAVDTRQGDYVETFPAITQEGPQIYDTPADQIEVPLTTTFPWIQSEPKVYDTPADTAIEIPSINIFPEAKAKELGDNILWASGDQWIGKDNSYKLSDKRYQDHIVTNHGPNSTVVGKSKFNSSFDIKSGIDEVLKSPNSIQKPNTNGRGGNIFELKYINPIGINAKGRAINTLKVVVDEFKNVTTAYPIK